MITTTSLNRYVRTRTDGLDRECACANARAYLVGNQRGGFPRVGWHSPGEMSGLWLHPVKLADGFWLEVQDAETGESEWLVECAEYVSGPFWSTHTYAGVLRGLCVRRTEFAPDDIDGVVVRYVFTQQGNECRRSLRRINLRFAVKAHLVPVWGSRLSRESGGSYIGSYLPGIDAVAVTDERRTGFLVAGIDRPIISHSFAEKLAVPEETGDGGLYAQLCSEIEVGAEGETCVNLFLAGSASSPGREVSPDRMAAWSRAASLDRAAEALELMRANHVRLYQDKAARIERQMSVCELTVPDPAVREAFDFGKLSVEILERSVEGVGAGLCAGLPEYPWWFGCDTCFAVPGLLVSGRRDLALSTMRLLARATQLDNSLGRVPHEVVTDGTVANPGNTQETPHFIATVREVWKWTGDDGFVSELYPLCRQGFDWLFRHMDEDGDLLPEGYGIAEVANLNVEMLDTAFHTLKAAEALEDIAEYLGDTETEQRAAQVRMQLSRDIDRRFWLDDEGVYGDMIARPSQMIERISDIKNRPHGSKAFRERVDRIEAECRAAADDSERSWSFGLSLPLVLLLDHVVPQERRARLLQLFESPAFTGPYGILMTASAEGASMTITTGQMIMAEFLAGHPEEAVEYIHRMQKTAELRFPGYPSEISPDKGCFVQAWTNYGSVFAVIRGLFGIDPHVPRKRLVVRPCLPGGWSEATVRRLPIGHRYIDIEVTREGTATRVVVIPCDGLGDLALRGEIEGMASEANESVSQGRNLRVTRRTPR